LEEPTTKVSKLYRGSRSGGRWWGRDGGQSRRAVDGQHELGPGPGHDRDGGPESIEIMLFEVLTEKLCRDA
jgi:hypothetical protein